MSRKTKSDKKKNPSIKAIYADYLGKPLPLPD